jgi:hypothetical protein
VSFGCSNKIGLSVTNLTVQQSIQPNGGYWVTIMKQKLSPLLFYSNSLIMQPSLTLVQRLDVLGGETMYWLRSIVVSLSIPVF